MKCGTCNGDEGRLRRILGPGSEVVICQPCEQTETANCELCERRWFDQHIIGGKCPICREEEKK